MRLIDADKLLQEFHNKGIHIEFDLPVEEILGEDVDLDDFAMLMQDGVMAYKKMVIDTIKSQPTVYYIESVIKKLESLDESYHKNKFAEYEQILHFAIEIVKAGIKNE